MATQKHGTKLGISWTEETYNPIVGCSVVSPGCTNCYAMHVAGDRLDRPGGPTHYQGLTIQTKAGPVWSGKIAAAPDKKLLEPLRWQRPRMIFVNSMGDVFHENVPVDMIDRVFAVMALTPQHTYQMLTKRHERQRAYINDPATPGRIAKIGAAFPDVHGIYSGDNSQITWDGARLFDSREAVGLRNWPLPHLWLGVSVEDQERLLPRLSALLQTRAAVRWISYEPALGPLYLGEVALTADEILANTGNLDLHPEVMVWARHGEGAHFYDLGGLHWLVYGEESGRHARRGNPEWARKILEETRRYHDPSIAFFMKQMQPEGGGGILKNLADFPEDLRVRNYPAGAKVDGSPQAPSGP